MDHGSGGPTWIVQLDRPGPGVRLAVKDCIDVAGLPTTVGCPVIAERARPAAQDAAVVAAARRSGAQIVGKTNLAVTDGQAAAANRTRDSVREWFAALQASHRSWPCRRWWALRR